MQMDWGKTSANLGTEHVGHRRIGLRFRILQNDEYCADCDTLKASSKNRVSNDRDRLVDDHVRQEESHEKQVATLSDRLNPLRVALLFAKRRIRVEGSGGFRNGRKTRTHGVPLMLNTFGWVSPKLMYPKANPANTPERMTRTGMRHPKMIFWVSGSSSRLADWCETT